jgi:TRAP-type C4-dicarboxylate transport system permease small subunit
MLSQTLLAFERRTTALATAAAQLLLAVAVVCGAYQVVVRFIFNNPSDWTEVTTRVALIWMVYLGIAVALRTGALVSVDLLYRLSKGVWQRRLELLITLAVLAFLAVMIVFGALVTWRIRFQELAGLYISISWAYLAIPVGGLFAAVAVIAHYFDPQRHELETAV